MRIAPFVAAGAFALGTLVTAPAAHAAIEVEGPGAEIAWVKNNVVVKGSNPDQATIMVKYRCSGTGVHLWASVKQGGITGPGVPASEADSWYETPEGPTPTCDGKNHVQRFTVTRSEEGDFDRLEKGRGWVQFAFFYIDENGEFARAGASGYGSVKAPRR